MISALESWTKAVIHAVGQFRRTEIPVTGWTIPAGCTLAIVGEGATTLLDSGDRGQIFSWTADDTAYKTARAACFNVVDFTATADANGLYAPIIKAADLATCKATPGSWWTDNTTVWVRTSDDRQPDANVLLLLSTFTCDFTLGAGSTVYLENFVRYGRMAFDGTDGQGRVVLNDVSVSLVQETNAALAATDVGEVYLFDCITAYSIHDGNNYHYAGTADPGKCLVFEEGCTVYECGTDSGDQQSTAHEGVSVVRVNGSYNAKTGSGQCIADVNGCDTLLVNCNVVGTSAEGAKASDDGGTKTGRITIIDSYLEAAAGQNALAAPYARLRRNIIQGAVSVTKSEII